MLTVEDLHKIINYCPNTGKFTRNPKCKKVARKLTAKGYLRFRVNGKMYMAHRLAWLYMTGEFPVLQIDHINRLRSDNRWCNLREATNSENQFNSFIRLDNTSGCKGVSFDYNTGKWRAYMQNNKKWSHIGLFKSKDEAIIAVQEAMKKHRGEFFY